MKVRVKRFASFAAFALCVDSAEGAITGSVPEYAPGTGALAGFDIYRLYASLTPTGTETGATGLQSADVIVNSGSANLKFKFADYDFTDAVPDADVLGKTSSQPVTNTSSVGTFIRVGSVGSFNVVTVSPPGYISDPNGDGVTDTDPSANYAAVKTFRVAGFNTNPDASAIGGNGGKGALFAVIVLPHSAGSTGDWVAVAQLAADKGNAYTLIYDVPEPASVGLLGLGAFGVVVGRRPRWGGRRT
jgi:hypothetical protein